MITRSFLLAVRKYVLLLHLHQESRLPRAKLSLAPTRQYSLSTIPNVLGSWYVTADLAEQHQEGSLPEEGGLAGHIGTGYQAEPLACAADGKVVCNKLPGSKVLFDNRVPCALKLKHILIGEDGFAIGVGDSR